MPEEMNPFKIAQSQVDAVAKMLDLDEGLTEFLKNPARAACELPRQDGRR